MIEQHVTTLSTDDEARWHAVLNRDSGAHGAFVYAVRSTGIYCRPTCPSRRPARHQVLFFPAPEAAEREGFRPCRRCQPRDTEDPQADVALVERACEIIRSNLDAPLTLAELGREVGLSPYHLQRVFRRVTGITPHQYLESQRMEELKAQLKEGRSVTHALYEAGYSSSSRLYERAPAQLGMTPRTYRRGGEGMSMTYTIVDCRLGRLLVAWTGRGVCAVSLGDADAPLEAALRGEYPRAEIRREATSPGGWVGALVEHLDGQQPRLDLPLDLQATAFQWRVWKELQAIPYGATRTYSEVARSLGRPAAARAVARACATNPVSIVVPCHRVLREDGGLGGYRWGLDRKRALIAQERTVAERASETEGQDTAERESA